MIKRKVNSNTHDNHNLGSTTVLRLIVNLKKFYANYPELSVINEQLVEWDE